jgi:hypothetical protein
MATYLNDLRLTELATGEGSGTWGTTTNTSLELIGEALGFATQQVFGSDADATTTIADGASDPARAMYFKITSAGSLTATRTCTIAPNTISRVMFIENATTGSQSIQISQGSGASVTILAGKTAVVYLDGAGAGAAVVDAMAGVDPGVTDTLAEVLAAGNTSGANNLIIDNGQAITTNTINETTAASGVTIDSVLLKDDGVNATNLEITNIKANDGTSAGSIADSTGVVTLASSVLTTADINGGTIDGTTLGATTPASVAATTGSFSSTLGVTGAATFSSTVAGAFNGTLGATTPASVAATTLSTTGAATFGGNVTGKNATFVTTTAASLISIGDTAAGTYSLLRMYGGSGKYNFQVGVQNNVNNAFEITPSTAVGGTTFTTPALLIDGTTGAATFGGEVNVTYAGNLNTTVKATNSSAGTSALARFIAVSDGGNAQLTATSTTYTDIAGAADSMVLNASSLSGGIKFANDGVVDMTLDASGDLTTTGAATFSGNVVGLTFESSVSSSSTNLATNSGGSLTLKNTSVTDGNFSNIGGYNSNTLVTSQINFVNVSQASRTGAITFNVHNGASMPEVGRFDASGNLLVGQSVNNTGKINTVTAPSTYSFAILNTAGSVFYGGFYESAAGLTASWSGADTAMFLSKDTTSSRSINAAGTLNASGADYAEYEQNNGLTIIKGSVVGFKSDGTLTLTFSEAVRFAIKSTNPSYVGGDTWGTEEQVGIRPVKPADDADDEVVAKYEADLATFETALEAARQLVDRIAYSGKVPVNVQGATAGDYIIAVAADDGSIDGQAVSNPDFSQYKLSVGRVNRILDDGRAEVAVIIH